MRWIAVVGLAALGTLGLACCITFASVAMHLAKETALIVWDGEHKVEHFVRKADFEGEAKDFGFILPVPTQPFAIEVAHPNLFGRLEAMQPRGGIGCGKASGYAMKASKGGGVEVLEEKIVGDYEVAVLRASDGKSLSAWLAKRGHRMRPAMTPWFDHYAQKGWVFVAFKYAGKKGPTPTKAVRVSFKADRPHYPYKMPSDTWEPGHYRPLDLFVISKTEMDGRLLDGSRWMADKRWVNEISDTNGVSSLLGGPSGAIDLGDLRVITRFSNTSAANRYEFDLTFEPAPKRQPLIASLSIAGIAVVWWARRKRRLATAG